MSLTRTDDGTGYKFYYDLKNIEELRMVANKDFHIISNKMDLHKKGNFSYLSWGRICTAMDRIEDTLDYINNTPIGNRGLKIAFDFIEFINNQFTIIESIKALAEIFNVSTKETKALKSAFNKSATDDAYFTYLRSLCAAHSANTTYRSERGSFMKEKEIYTCPRVIWESTTHIYNDDRDLSVEVYDGTGIKYPDKCCEEDLFTMLYRPFYYRSGPFENYGYELSKIYYLEKEKGSLDLHTIRNLLEVAKPAINEYVVFTNSESDEETLTLIELAFYLNALDGNNYLNKNILNSDKFRVNVLTTDRYNELLSWEEDDSVEISPFELGLFD